MAENTKIEWADNTWNPWWGCTKVSVGEKGACEHCYAEGTGHRFGVAWGNHPRKRAGPKHLALPYHWQRKAIREGTRPFVFCASMADIFDNQVDPTWRAEAFATMRECDRLVWLLLTKRPSMIEKLANEAGGLPRNAAIGASIVTQEEWNRDALSLAEAADNLKPAFTFISAEPLMGAINLTEKGRIVLSNGYDEPLRPAPMPGWVIAGGESGPKARPSHPDWFRSLRDQCAAAGVPFLFKQWGEWAPGEEWPIADAARDMTEPERVNDNLWLMPKGHRRCVELRKTGKSKLTALGIGRDLDGREHNEFPAGFGKQERAAA